MRRGKEGGDREVKWGELGRSVKQVRVMLAMAYGYGLWFMTYELH